MYPTEYRYSKEHEWIKVEGDAATIGITDYAQEQLGDVVFVEFPETGATLDANQPFGTVESVKAVSDVYCPVTGSITESNAVLNDNPALVNEDPHGKGWLIKLKLNDPKELEGLMTAEQYQAFIKEEE
jgi:glycine cleavage system H protein